MSVYGMNVLIGDSIAHGARDEHNLSPARLIGRSLSTRTNQNWVCVEEGINGETTSDLLRRMYQTVKKYQEAAEVIVCIGTNDAKPTPVSEKMFRDNYDELIRIVKMLKKPCYVCTLPHRKGFGSPSRPQNDAIDSYNEVIRELAETHGCGIIPLHKLPEKMKCDGVHLTHEGNQWFADRVVEALMKDRS